MTTKPYLLHIFEDRVAFEKVTDGPGPSPCLLISRSLAEAPLDVYVDYAGKVLKDYRGGQLIPLDAIFGIYHLLSGPYVALVIDSEVVVSHGAIEFRKVGLLGLPLTSCLPASSIHANESDGGPRFW